MAPAGHLLYAGLLSARVKIFGFDQVARGRTFSYLVAEVEVVFRGAGWGGGGGRD